LILALLSKFLVVPVTNPLAVVAMSFRAFAQNHLRVRSIRGQLALGVAAALVPCVAFGFYATQQYTRARFLASTHSRLQSESELISYGLDQWGRGVTRLVESLAINPAFRAGRVNDIQIILDRVAATDPDRLWRFWSASKQPKLLAYAGGTITADAKEYAEQHQFSRDYYQAALRGVSTYEVVMSRTTGRTCLNVVRPVFAEPSLQRAHFQDSHAISNGSLLGAPFRSDLTGVLVLCIPLNQIGLDTGLAELFKDQRLSLLHGNNKQDYLKGLQGFNSAIILVSNTGQLLFPDVQHQNDRIPLIADLKSSNLPGLYDVARQAMAGKEIFVPLSGHGQRYSALTSKVDSAWSLILILNDRSVNASVNAISRVQGLVGLLTLAFALLIVVVRARSLSRPLSEAGVALQRISTGDFDVQMSPAADDEIGGLMSNIQIAANRLKAYLSEVTTFAVTQKQIDTAKSIQQDFLLSVLPASPTYDVAAFSRPALEIGADWYDMVDTGDHVVFLVADVCDKGVPSALYMSVFRSLIRSKLLEYRHDLEDSQCASNAMQSAIEQTNSYMASNQNASMMFATVFIAVANKRTGVLDCLCAGHEAPVLIRGGAVQLLDQVSGPAIGLFEGANYDPFRLQLERGDTIVVYSDGLIDARGPANTGWGRERLLDLLPRLNPPGSEQLLASIVSVVDEYMDGSDQFDDLTVMVFRWKGEESLP